MATDDRPLVSATVTATEEIHEALDYGVVKMNVDTDMQYAFTRAVAGQMFKNDDGVLNVVTGYGAVVGEPLVTHPKVAKVIRATGDQVAKRAPQIGKAVADNAPKIAEKVARKAEKRPGKPRRKRPGRGCRTGARHPAGVRSGHRHHDGQQGRHRAGGGLEQEVELAPVDVGEELLERAVQHRPAPGHRLVAVRCHRRGRD